MNAQEDSVSVSSQSHHEYRRVAGSQARFGHRATETQRESYLCVSVVLWLKTGFEKYKTLLMVSMTGCAVKLFLLISGVLLFPLPASGRSGVPGTPLPRQSEYAIRFKDHLRLASDLTLTATVTYASITFRCESRWRPSRASRLHLFIAHSPNLDGNRSFLSISLNYGILRSLRLDA